MIVHIIKARVWFSRVVLVGSRSSFRQKEFPLLVNNKQKCLPTRIHTNATHFPLLLFLFFFVFIFYTTNSTVNATIAGFPFFRLNINGRIRSLAIRGEQTPLT